MVDKARVTARSFTVEVRIDVEADSASTAVAMVKDRIAVDHRVTAVFDDEWNEVTP